jgi:hypothetical protein
MSTQHLGNLLHRLEPGTHGSSTPIIQEFASPGGTYVTPEALEIFLEQIGPDGFEVDSQQFLEFDNLLVCQVFRPFEQTPTAAGKYRFFSSGLQLPRLRGSDLVDSFAKVGHNVEAIDDLHSLTGNLDNDSQIGFPHIAADKTESCGTFFAEFLEEPPQGFLGPFLSDPQEAFATGVDLIDQGQIFMSFLPGDFVNAEGQHVFQVAMRQPPCHGHLDRAEYIFPRGLEGNSGLLPGKPFGPLGQKPGVSGGQMVFPIGPGHSFHLYPAIGAVDSSHGVKEENSDSPQRDEFKAAKRQSIVARTALSATRADWPAAFPRADLDVERCSHFPCDTPADRAIYKTSMQLYPIQYTFELHPVFSSLAMDFLVEFHNAKENNGMLYFQPPSGKNIFNQHTLRP